MKFVPLQFSTSSYKEERGGENRNMTCIWSGIAIKTICAIATIRHIDRTNGQSSADISRMAGGAGRGPDSRILLIEFPMTK